jgi:hypothetical protein
VVLHQEPGREPILVVHGGTPHEEEELDTAEEERVGFIEAKLKDHVAEGLDGVRLFSTIFSRRVIPLANRMTKMWKYSGHTDPNQVSPKAASHDEIWSWLKMVLKVGNQRVVGGLSAFDKEHPPNLVSFSSLRLPISLRAPDHVLTLACFLGARSSPIPPPPSEVGGGRGQAESPSRGFSNQEMVAPVSPSGGVLSSPARLELEGNVGATLALVDVETEIGLLVELEKARTQGDEHLDQVGDPPVLQVVPGSRPPESSS